MPRPENVSELHLRTRDTSVRSFEVCFVTAPGSDAFIAYIDGGARGNPGPAGYGVRIERPDGTLVDEFGQSIGVATNNVAEYRGLIAALEWARREGHRRLHVRSDSLLLVQQMLGRF